MSDMFQDFSGGKPFEPLPEQQSPAPALPIEAHIVGATLAVEKMKGLGVLDASVAERVHDLTRRRAAVGEHAAECLAQARHRAALRQAEGLGQP